MGLLATDVHWRPWQAADVRGTEVRIGELSLSRAKAARDGVGRFGGDRLGLLALKAGDQRAVLEGSSLGAVSACKGWGFGRRKWK